MPLQRSLQIQTFSLLRPTQGGVEQQYPCGMKKLVSEAWISQLAKNGLPGFELKDVAAQAPAGREPVWERQKHLHHNAGTGPQTSPERWVSYGNNGRE